MSEVASAGARPVTYTFLGDDGGADDFVVTGFEGAEALNRPYRYSIELAARDSHLDPHELLGRGAMFTLDRDGHSRFVQGIVERVVVDDRERELTATAVLVPALVASKYTTTTRIFQDLSALDIVEQVLTEDLGRYRRSVESPDLDRARFTQRDYCVQYQETNLDFVHRLLEEEGVGYYFRHDDHAEVLVLFEEPSSLSRAATVEEGPLRFEGRGGDHTTAEHIYRFATQTALTTRSVTVRDHDWVRGLPTVEAGAQSEESPASVGESYEHGLSRSVTIHEDSGLHAAGTAAAIAAALPHGMPLGLEHRVHSLPGAVLPPWTSNDVDKQAAIRGQGHRRDGRLFQGSSRVTGLAPGRTFELIGSLGFDDGGDYYLTKVSHRGGTRSDGGEYDNDFECLAIETAWRPERRARKPRIQGVQTAKVTGPVGMDVHTDPLGRVKVIFNWDRAAFDPAGNQTCWLRVAQVWAGQGAPGFSFIPRVGMEVIVSFVDGDPDRPLVIGCVNNATHPTPGMLPVQATKSIIRTRTVPHGAGHNEISFEDAQGMERVHIRAQRDLDELVLNDHSSSVRGSKHSFVGRTAHETVMGGKRLHLRGNYRSQILGRRTESTLGSTADQFGSSLFTSVRRSYELEVGAAATTRVPSGSYLLQVKGSVLIAQDERQEIRMTPNAPNESIQIVSGTSFVRVSGDAIRLEVGSSSIEISNAMVRINGKVFPSS